MVAPSPLSLSLYIYIYMIFALNALTRDLLVAGLNEALSY